MTGYCGYPGPLYWHETRRHGIILPNRESGELLKKYSEALQSEMDSVIHNTANRLLKKAYASSKDSFRKHLCLLRRRK